MLSRLISLLHCFTLTLIESLICCKVIEKSLFQNGKGDRYNLSMLDQEWDSLQVQSKIFKTSSLMLCHLASFSYADLFLFQKMSYNRVSQLRDLQNIIEEISRAIMWVNEKEEEELVFDWGDKNIDTYIPKKQESYSVRGNPDFPIPVHSCTFDIGLICCALFSGQRLMSDLEVKEKELNKLKVKADGLINNNHPASDKIQVRPFLRCVCLSYVTYYLGAV